MATVQRNRQKDWVQRLFVPYIVFFALSCLVSAVSMVVKMQIIRQKFLSRHEAAALMGTVSPASSLVQSRERKSIEQLTVLAKAAATKARVAENEAKVRGVRVREEGVGRWGSLLASSGVLSGSPSILDSV